MHAKRAYLLRVNVLSKFETLNLANAIETKLKQKNRKFHLNDGTHLQRKLNGLGPAESK